MTSSVGIPGTGLYYTTSSDGKKRRSSSHKSSNASAIRAQQQAKLQQQKVTEAANNEEQCTVLSVLIDREHLGSINLEMIDPSAAVSSFPCHIDFKKTQGLKPVSRIEI